MKAYLFVLLLAIAFCNDVTLKGFNPLDVITCLVKNQVVVSVVTELVNAVLEKNWVKAASVVFANYAKVVDAVKGCLA